MATAWMLATSQTGPHHGGDVLKQSEMVDGGTTIPYSQDKGPADEPRTITHVTTTCDSINDAYKGPGPVISWLNKT